MDSASSIDLTNPFDCGRSVRFQACRILYRDCSILQARDFERALHERLLEGLSFFGHRSIEAEGLSSHIYYDIVIDLRRWTRVMSVVSTFGLPGDGAVMELLSSPPRGESSLHFLRR